MSQPRKILVATDLSPAGDVVVTYAINLATSLNANLHLLHVCEPMTDVGSVVHELTAMDEVERDAIHQLDRLRTKISGSDIAVTRDVELGMPARVIVHAAARLQSDLIVMGSHGRRGLRRALLGSVAENVLRSAPCPVLVVRSGEEEAR